MKYLILVGDGMDIQLAPDEIAFRFNMVTLDTGAGHQASMRYFCAGHIPMKNPTSSLPT